TSPYASCLSPVRSAVRFLRPAGPTLLPYTTLFRSVWNGGLHLGIREVYRCHTFYFRTDVGVVLVEVEVQPNVVPEDQGLARIVAVHLELCVSCGEAISCEAHIHGDEFAAPGVEVTLTGNATRRDDQLTIERSRTVVHVEWRLQVFQPHLIRLRVPFHLKIGEGGLRETHVAELSAIDLCTIPRGNDRIRIKEE